MTIKEKRIVINWMMNQIEAKEMAEQKAVVGDFTLDQCWSVSDGILCYGNFCGKQTIDVIADALGVVPEREQKMTMTVERVVSFLGTRFYQIEKSDKSAEEEKDYE